MKRFPFHFKTQNVKGAVQQMFQGKMYYDVRESDMIYICKVFLHTTVKVVRVVIPVQSSDGEK